MTWGLVVIGFLAAFVASWYAFTDVVDCSPPSQRELEAQQAFVEAHVSDASNFELGALDCDDNGAGYVYFTTGLTPAAAEATFLAEGSCSYSQVASNDRGVVCTSDGVQVQLFFEAVDDKRTDGELYMD